MFDSLPLAQRRLAFVMIAVLVAGALVTAVLVVGQVKGHKASPTTGDLPVAPVAQDEPGPVIVLPGYGGGLNALVPIVAVLRGAHRDVVVFTPTKHESDDLRTQGVLLRALVSRTLRKYHTDSVDVVGYSAGGVVARLWVRDYGGAKVARRVLSISSPQHGTSRSKIESESSGNSCPAACQQLTKGSSLLSHLNSGDETPEGPEWITLRSSTDSAITPADSAELKGALNLLVQKGCPKATTTHSAMSSDSYVLAALITTLGASPPAAPTSFKC